MSQTRIGISGWSYDGWRGDFYPEDLPRARELEYASRRFNSIEINASFYSLQRPETYRRWYEATPAHFVFAVKGSRFITHNKKLQNVEKPLANFLASGVLLLREKLGPLLWQLPPRARFEAERLEAFFHLLPRNIREATRLARSHDRRVKETAWTKADGNHRIRHAIEVRNETYLCSDLVRLARRFNIAIVFSDSRDWPYVEELTAGFVYLRLHGHGKTYASRYGAQALEQWKKRIEQWRAGQEPEDAVRITTRKPPRRKHRDVYVYFDNDQKAWAPHDALTLAERVGAEPRPEG